MVAALKERKPFSFDDFAPTAEGLEEVVSSCEGTPLSGTLVSRPVAGGRLVALAGGTGDASMPDRAEALVADLPRHLPREEGISVTPRADGLLLVEVQVGRLAHSPGPRPNAIARLVDYLWAHGLHEASQRPFLEMERLIFASVDGATIGLSSREAACYGFCLGCCLRTVEGRFEQTILCRVPQTMEPPQARMRLRALAHAHCCDYLEG